MATKELEEPKKYDFTKSHFDMLGTAFSDIKNEINGHGFRPIEAQDGLTLLFSGNNLVTLSHTKYVVANPYMIKTKDLPDAQDFLKKLTTELAKRYKQYSKNNIEFKLKNEDQTVQLYSNITPDKSFFLGSGSPGIYSQMSRFLVTTKHVYEVKTKLLK